jgi:hypothetical protein
VTVAITFEVKEKTSRGTLTDMATVAAPGTLLLARAVVWTLGVLAIAWLGGCGGNAIVGEGRPGAGGAEAGTEPEAGTGGSLGTGGSSGTGPSSAGGGSAGSGGATVFPDPFAANDPCDAAGFIELFLQGYVEGEEAVKATVYVVTFDPPRILMMKELTRTAFGDWQGRIDHTELPGARDCMALRSDAVFVLYTLKDGSPALPEHGIGFNVVSPTFGWCSAGGGVAFDPRTEPISVVRAFGFYVGQSKMDGPFPMSRGSADEHAAFLVDGPDAGVLSCNKPRYLHIVAAHQGALLVGLMLGLPGDP